MPALLALSTAAMLLGARSYILPTTQDKIAERMGQLFGAEEAS